MTVVGPVATREVHLVAYPEQAPTRDCFRVVSTELPPLRDDQVLVRSQLLSVDPYMRRRMKAPADADPQLGVFALDATVPGRAVGEILARGSAVRDLAIGDVVLHWGGWRTTAVVDAASTTPVLAVSGLPLESALAGLGATGLTAYIGLTRIGRLRDGDIVYVSAAAGAVGSMAGQLAQALGAARVIGSAGTADKARYLIDDLGFDDAFNYREAGVAEALRALAPGGVDLYFDNVGGEHLRAVLPRMALHGRIVACGAISQYDAPSEVSYDLTTVLNRRLTLRGFMVGDHADLQERFVSEVGPRLASGEIRSDYTVFDGIESVADAFVAMLSGDTRGKTLVRC